jgi:inorganic pyrophosphatase
MRNRAIGIDVLYVGRLASLFAIHGSKNRTPCNSFRNHAIHVIETPKGSRNKYNYDPDCDCLQLSTVLPEGMVFPHDFGFIPSTLGDDGDPLDILILMEASVVPGCVVRTRVIGGIEARQKEKGERWTKNDRLIAVARTHRLTKKRRIFTISGRI